VLVNTGMTGTRAADGVVIGAPPASG
jgi:hypothetical protein